jgi:hypothetical protein
MKWFFLLMMVCLSHLGAISKTSMLIECSLRPIDRSIERSDRVQPSVLLDEVSSQNWSGYVGTASHSTAGSVSWVAGAWTVPMLHSTSNAAYSSAWVGIDGFSDSTVEQIGTEHDWTGRSQSNYAWFEMYPSGAYEIVGFPVNPGDTIYALVEYIGNGYFQLIIENLTRRVYFSVPLSYTHAPSAQRRSAEWIVEAPYYKGILPLANFGRITFTQCEANISGATASLVNSHWGSEAIEMETSTRIIKAVPSATYASGCPSGKPA